MLTLLLAAVLQHPDTMAGASVPPSRYAWTAETWSQSVLKRGKDRYVIFGARLAGSMQFSRLSLVGRLDASALPDGGGQKGSVSFEDPGSFQTIEGYAGAHFKVAGPLSLAVIGGVARDIEGGRVRTYEQTPITASGGVRVALGKEGYLYALAGRHDAAGSGTKALFTLRLPIKAGTALVGDGALGGSLSFVRYGISYGLHR